MTLGIITTPRLILISKIGLDCVDVEFQMVGSWSHQFALVSVHPGVLAIFEFDLCE